MWHSLAVVTMLNKTWSRARTCRVKWHSGQLEKQRNIGGKQTDHKYNRLGGVFMQMFNVVILIALVEHITRPDAEAAGPCTGPGAGVCLGGECIGGVCMREVSGSGRRKVIGVLVFEFAVVVVLALLVLQRAARSWGRQLRRFVTIAAGVLFIVMFVLYLAYFGRDASAGFTNIVLLAFANVTLGIVIVQLVLYIAPYNELGVAIVNAGYYAADTVVGLCTFAVVFVLSIVPLVHSIQSLLLFNNKVLAKSRAGQQLKAFEAASGFAGAAALHPGANLGAPTKSGGLAQPAHGAGSAAAAGGAGGAAAASAPQTPLGAVGPIPQAAADPQAVQPPLQPRWDMNMTVGTSIAQNTLAGGAFARSGSSYGTPTLRRGGARVSASGSGSSQSRSRQQSDRASGPGMGRMPEEGPYDPRAGPPPGAPPPGAPPPPTGPPQGYGPSTGARHRPGGGTGGGRYQV